MTPTPRDDKQSPTNNTIVTQWNNESVPTKAASVLPSANQLAADHLKVLNRGNSDNHDGIINHP